MDLRLICYVIQGINDWMQSIWISRNSNRYVQYLPSECDEIWQRKWSSDISVSAPRARVSLLSITPLFLFSFNPSFILFFVLSFIHSFLHSLFHSFALSFMWCFRFSSLSLANSFVPLYFHSFIHSFILSFIHSFTDSPDISFSYLCFANSYYFVQIVHCNFCFFFWFIHSFIPSLTWHFRFSSSSLVNSAHSVIIHSFI